MARRIRSLKPEILEDEKTAGLSDTAFRVFVGLITMADDYGTFRADPRFIEKQIYWLAVPERSVATALLELEATGMVALYEVRGQRYGRFSNWTRHQRVDNARKEGSLPCQEGSAATRRDSPRLAAGSGSGSGSGWEGRGSDAPAREAVPEEPRTSTARLKSVPPPPAEPPEHDRIRDAILAESKLSDLDAVDLASEALTTMMAKGFRLEWMLQAVRDAASKTERGEQRHVRHGRLIGFFRRAKPKRDETDAKMPPAQRETDDQEALARIRRTPQRIRPALDKSAPPEQVAGFKALLGKIGTGGG
jgi:hypothetical protein